MNKDSKIFVAGHLGLVGSAILRNLKEKGYCNFILRSKEELDLTSQRDVDCFFETEKPEFVFLAAAKVGGIMANNTYRAQFIYENIMIQSNIIHCAWKYGVKKLLFLGSTCIYPKDAHQPIKEDYLLTSPLEYTNEPYAIAKIAGIKMCESYNIQYGTNFLSVMPTNLYGPNDNFDLETSHVLPALIRKMYLAKCIESSNWEELKRDISSRPLKQDYNLKNVDELLSAVSKYGIFKDNNGKTIVEIWGTGSPLREFLWSEDMADACVFLMEKINFNDVKSNDKELKNTHINIGSGEEITIKELSYLIKNIIGFRGDIVFNSSKPDGTYRKFIDSKKLNELGWTQKISLEQGINRLFEWYKS